jgi:uncharacterized protein YdaU (DUF1376 family)
MSNHWMPIHIGDYHRETQHLTAEQHGAYVLLQMAYWTKGGLPDDDAQLARIASMTNTQWRRARPTLQALFVDGWKHPRLDAEMERAAKISAKYSARAQKGAAARWKNAEAEKTQCSQGEHDASSNAEALLDECLDMPNPQPQPHSPSESKAPAAPAPSAEEAKPKKRKGKAPSPATFLPDDWKPSAEHIALAKDHGLTDLNIDRDAVKFRNYFTREKRTARKHWLGTWENWVIGTAQKLNLVPVAAAGDTKPTTRAKVYVGTPQWEAWQEYRKRTGKVSMSPTELEDDEFGRPRLGHMFESEWPPGYREQTTSKPTWSTPTLIEMPYTDDLRRLYAATELGMAA